MFKVGDHVQVMEGVHAGRVGIVSDASHPYYCVHIGGFPNDNNYFYPELHDIGKWYRETLDATVMDKNMSMDVFIEEYGQTRAALTLHYSLT